MSRLISPGKTFRVVLFFALYCMICASRGLAFQGSSLPQQPGPAFAGTYSGLLPCADCEGIRYRLVLKPDGTYQERMTYQGKPAAPFTSTGKYTVTGDSLIKLDKKDPGMNMFSKHPKGLLMLDTEGHRVSGQLADHYVLVKLTRGSDKSGEENIKKELLYRKWKTGIQFIAMGNEPFWGLDINFRRFMRFYTPGGDTLVTPPSKGIRAMDADVIMYRSQTDKGSLRVQVQRLECADPMSGEKFDYKVMVDISRGAGSEEKHYEGCGRYIPDFRLEGNWNLAGMNGSKPDTANYPRGIPNLEMQVVEERFSGSAGCNRMMGKFMRDGINGIRFSPAATTMMFCPNLAKENELLKALGTVDGYLVNKDRLQFSRRGKVVLLFSKAASRH